MTPLLEEFVNNYNHQTSLLYKAMGVLQYIITTKDVYTYLDETPSYIELATKFFKKEEKKSLVKKVVSKITSNKDN